MSEVLITPQNTTSLKYQIQDDSCGRIDKYLVSQLEGSRSFIQQLIKENRVTVNNSPVRNAYLLKVGDKVTVVLPPQKKLVLEAKDLDIPVIYDDEFLAILDKPAGLSVHPILSDLGEATVVNHLIYRFGDKEVFESKRIDPNQPDTLRPGIIHRLDKFTSGLLITAKTNAVLASMKDQFRTRSVRKEYTALVDGTMEFESGFISKPIERDENNFQKFKTSLNGGKEATTEYTVLKKFSGFNRQFTLVTVHPKTGRTHQIRVHFASIKHPVVGDRLYGGSYVLDRYFLHASKIEFAHPISGERLIFNSDLPPELKTFLKSLTEI